MKRFFLGSVSALAWGLGMGIVLYAPIELLRLIGGNVAFYGPNMGYQIERAVVVLGITIVIFGFIMLIRRRNDGARKAHDDCQGDDADDKDSETQAEV